MTRKSRLDPVSVLTSIKKKASLRQSAPLAGIPSEEISAFQALRAILSQSRLLPSLSETESTDHGERVAFVDEDLVQRHYPGADILSGRLPAIDAFIYVYDGITGPDTPAASTKRDFRRFFGELGFRQLLLELQRACAIHRFCSDNLRRDRIVIEPLTRKPTADARKDAFKMPGRAKDVFQQIARRIAAEIDMTQGETPQVFRDAFQFSHDMTAVLEPLARIGRQIR